MLAFKAFLHRADLNVGERRVFAERAIDAALAQGRPDLASYFQAKAGERLSKSEEIKDTMRKDLQLSATISSWFEPSGTILDHLNGVSTTKTLSGFLELVISGESVVLSIHSKVRYVLYVLFASQFTTMIVKNLEDHVATIVQSEGSSYDAVISRLIADDVDTAAAEGPNTLAYVKSLIAKRMNVLYPLLNYVTTMSTALCQYTEILAKRHFGVPAERTRFWFSMFDKELEDILDGVRTSNWEGFLTEYTNWRRYQDEYRALDAFNTVWGTVQRGGAGSDARVEVPLAELVIPEDMIPKMRRWLEQAPRGVGHVGLHYIPFELDESSGSRLSVMLLFATACLEIAIVYFKRIDERATLAENEELKNVIKQHAVVLVPNIASIEALCASILYNASYLLFYPHIEERLAHLESGDMINDVVTIVKRHLFDQSASRLEIARNQLLRNHNPALRSYSNARRDLIKLVSPEITPQRMATLRNLSLRHPSDESRGLVVLSTEVPKSNPPTRRFETAAFPLERYSRFLNTPRGTLPDLFASYKIRITEKGGMLEVSQHGVAELMALFVGSRIAANAVEFHHMRAQFGDRLTDEQTRALERIAEPSYMLLMRFGVFTNVYDKTFYEQVITRRAQHLLEARSREKVSTNSARNVAVAYLSFLGQMLLFDYAPAQIAAYNFDRFGTGFTSKFTKTRTRQMIESMFMTSSPELTPVDYQRYVGAILGPERSIRVPLVLTLSETAFSEVFALTHPLNRRYVAELGYESKTRGLMSSDAQHVGSNQLKLWLMVAAHDVFDRFVVYGPDSPQFDACVYANMVVLHANFGDRLFTYMNRIVAFEARPSVVALHEQTSIEQVAHTIMVNIERVIDAVDGPVERTCLDMVERAPSEWSQLRRFKGTAMEASFAKKVNVHFS